VTPVLRQSFSLWIFPFRPLLVRVVGSLLAFCCVPVKGYLMQLWLGFFFLFRMPQATFSGSPTTTHQMTPA